MPKKAVSSRRMFVLTLAAGLFAALCPAVAEAGPVSLSEFVEVDAPLDKVWSIVGNFADLSWVPGVKSTTAPDGNATGSQRQVDLGGPVLVEKLVTRQEKNHVLVYSILDNGTNQKIL